MGNVTAIKDIAAERAQDAATHGYNAREGDGAALLRECAKAVRIASRKAQARFSIPCVTPAERGDYTSELVIRLLGENDGRVPESAGLTVTYLVQRAEGLILNDVHRREIDLDTAPEANRRDPRLDGPLSIPQDVVEVAGRLELTETGRRALIAGAVPATREEWASHYGYASSDSWYRTEKRGRRELRELGDEPIRQAVRDVESEGS